MTPPVTVSTAEMDCETLTAVTELRNFATPAAGSSVVRLTPGCAEVPGWPGAPAVAGGGRGRRREVSRRTSERCVARIGERLHPEIDLPVPDRLARGRGRPRPTTGHGSRAQMIDEERSILRFDRRDREGGPVTQRQRGVFPAEIELDARRSREPRSISRLQGPDRRRRCSALPCDLTRPSVTSCARIGPSSGDMRRLRR